ncbi:hypothetical protein A6X21_06875 [Planctopirus hydrillae]|uniref:DUF1963 domain-containing protein n=1 Tax=Planctopirus hydrillae TaxID=1841610 RepID=A0A1C3E9X1_9PLAN|nr:hypothetical protein A6X21_06875 [Planctopirus hydrillae]
MLLFLQFDIDPRWSMPFEDGSHFLLFMCPLCNEIPSFAAYSGGQLSGDYWSRTEGHYFACLSKAGSSESIRLAEAILIAKELFFEPLKDVAEHLPDTIRLGGEPFWLQEPEPVICSCGSNMVLISQIAENYGFDKQPGAPEQPDSFSANQYCLFLGNEVYIFACPRQCDSRAVWVTVQG